MKYLDLWVCTIIAAPSHLPLTLSAQRKVRLDMLCVCVCARTLGVTRSRDILLLGNHYTHSTEHTHKHAWAFHSRIFLPRVYTHNNQNQVTDRRKSPMNWSSVGMDGYKRARLKQNNKTDRGNEQLCGVAAAAAAVASVVSAMVSLLSIWKSHLLIDRPVL